MSLTQTQLIKLYEKAIGADFGDVSGDSEALEEFVLYENMAKQDYLLLWAKSAGTWQGDDSGFTSYPIITRNIVSGQRDYDFKTDDQGNRITDVQKVLILPSETATEYVEISPIDELVAGEILLNTRTGVPTRYSKLANALFLDPIPNYSVASGIKMIVNREGDEYTVSDTTKTTGLPAYDEYLYLKPALMKAKQKSLANLVQLEKDVLDLEGSERLRVTGKIQEFFSQRERDVRRIMTPKKINYK